jgi:DNA polymerase I-like protein with 3'-5' exonuclease and polymerase domains
MLLREAVNFVIQSSASDFVQMFGHRLAVVLEGKAVPVLSNHDGLVFDVFRESELLDVVGTILTEQDRFATIVQSLFGVDLLVPFEWDIETGYNLYDMEELQNA